MPPEPATVSISKRSPTTCPIFSIALPPRRSPSARGAASEPFQAGACSLILRSSAEVRIERFGSLLIAFLEERPRYFAGLLLTPLRTRRLVERDGLLRISGHARAFLPDLGCPHAPA